MRVSAKLVWKISVRERHELVLAVGGNMEYYHEKVETEDKIPARIFFGGTGRDKLRYPMHWHHNLEFDLVLEGCIRGKIGKREVEIHPGEIFFVNSGELHETDGTGAGGYGRLRSITILLSDGVLREYCPELDSFYFVIETSGQQEQIRELILECAELYQKKQEFYELEISIVLHRICLFLLKECRREKQRNERERREWKSTGRIKQAITYMEQHYESTISIGRMAEVMGMTPSYFSRFFRQSTGQNFHSYLMQIRLCHAQQALTESEATVTEIALNCGFANVKSMIEVFKKECGMTPARYRKAITAVKLPF